MTGLSVGLFLTALALSTVSAYYSIVGLAAIFAASFWPVLILATTLEVGKLVLVSWLYRNWDQTPWPIRTYLTSAVIILMLITSLGIFGFLSKAHSEDQTQSQQIQLQITQINTQIETRQQQLAESRQTLEQLNRSINIQLDNNRAQQALANRRTQQAERDRVQARMDQLQTEILQLTERRTQIQGTQNLQDSKLGPVRYVVALVNPDADPNAAVKWIILVLVIVCDPLAVCMLMAANHKFKGPSSDGVPTMTNMPHSVIKWDPVQNKLLISDDQGVWHVFPQADAPPVSADAVITDTVKLVELTVSELIKQRPIWEVATTSWTPPRSHVIHAPDHAEDKSEPAVDTTPAPAAEPVDPQGLQKLIEQTLEAWMNKTLTVTYSADQTEIEQIVEKVIQQTMHKTQDVVSTTSHPDSHQTPVDTQEIVAEPTEPTAVVDLTYTPVAEEVTAPHDASAASDPTHAETTPTRPIYNYFGEERVRGGKKHNITT